MRYFPYFLRFVKICSITAQNWANLCVIMFIKAVKTKSNVQLKSSERKKLQQKVSTKFNVTQDELNTLFPNKSSISLVKIITHGEDIVSVYAVDKRPLFFETPDQVFLPTVYTLWLVPNMIPAFTTHPAVSEKFFFMH